MSELWYTLTQIPDLTLNQYASLEENGVDGVLTKHTAFLRQLNRKGVVSDVSFHLFYLYYVPEEGEKDRPGRRLHIFLMARGSDEALQNIPALVKASPLSDFFVLRDQVKTAAGDKIPATMANVLSCERYGMPSFRTCAFLAKAESFLPSPVVDGEDYYMIREWEMNEDGRLYDMCNLMEQLGHTTLYRVDLYPVEMSDTVRNTLRTPMKQLRGKQDHRSSGTERDYDGKDVIDNYEDLIERYDSSPHFITNIMVMADSREDAVAVIDAAGAESLKKGKYTICTFRSFFDPMSFLGGLDEPMENLREKTVVRNLKVRSANKGLAVCGQGTAALNVSFLPTLFTLEEAAPFFRLPALYDGEIIQLPKETAPDAVEDKDALFLGKDENGYDVNFPLKLLPKHAFISGVPGSGKTNTMHHLTSTLWKKHRIPFLVLEPAKQEYRALANDPGMKEMYLFSPNADMSFPLHINPFEMPVGTLVAEHIRRLCSVFEGAFPLEPPMPFLLDTAIEAVYRECGWIPEEVYNGRETREDGKGGRSLPTMSMLYRRLETELNSTTYSGEVRGNLESALKVRIGSLLRREMGDVFDVPRSTFTPEKWLEVPAVIELESMGAGPANFLTLMLCSLIRETLKAHPKYDKGDIRHVIFIEEAHNLIGPESEEQTGADADPKTAATAFVVKMLAEVRALKEGIIIADQLPTVMAQEVLKNTGLKIGLRITSSDDRSLLGGTMAASGLQLERMATFAVGEALLFYEKLKRPFIMRVKEWWGEEKDRKKKEDMVSPRGDAELRETLAGRATYLEAGRASIEIILEKYRGLLDETDELFSSTVNWFRQVTEMVHKYNDLNRSLIQKRINNPHDESEELVSKTRNLANSFVRIYDFFESSGDHFLDPGRITRKLSDLLYALERMKKGRWKRFGTREDQLSEVTKLQTTIVKKAREVYTFVLSMVNEMQGSDDPEIRKLTDTRSFSDGMREFLDAYETIGAWRVG